MMAGIVAQQAMLNAVGLPPSAITTIIADGSVSGTSTYTEEIDVGAEDSHRYFIAVFSHSRPEAAGVATNNLPTLDGAPFTSISRDYNDLWFNVALLRYPTGTGTKTFSLTGGAVDGTTRFMLFTISGHRLADYQGWMSSLSANATGGYSMDGLEGDEILTGVIGSQDSDPIVTGQTGQLGGTQDFAWSPYSQRQQAFSRIIASDGPYSAVTETSATVAARAAIGLKFRPLIVSQPDLVVETAALIPSRSQNQTISVDLGEEDADRQFILWSVQQRSSATGAITAPSSFSFDGDAMTLAGAVDTVGTSSAYRLRVYRINKPTGTGFVNLVISGGALGNADYYLLRVKGATVGSHASANNNTASKIEATLASVDAGDPVIAFVTRQHGDLDNTTRRIIDTAGADIGPYRSGIVREVGVRHQISVLTAPSSGSFTAGVVLPPSAGYQAVQLLRLVPT